MSDMKSKPIPVILSAPVKYKIKLDKERSLLFDLNAYEILEDIYGTLPAAITALQKDEKRMRNIKNFLYAGLIHEDKEITIEKAGTLGGYRNLSDISEILITAFMDVMPEAKEGSEVKEGE